MGTHDENKSAARKAIASLINLLKAESDIIGKDNPIPPQKLEEMKNIISKLHRELAVYGYLEENLEAEKLSEKEESIIIPAPTGYIPVVQFEKIPTEIPVIKEPEPTKQIPEIEKAKPIIEVPKIQSEKKFPDVKSLIGFNERLMFMNHLFGRDGSAYEAAIEQINACTSLDEANSFLSILSNEFKWNAESEPTFIFKSIVKRRFS